MELHRDLGARLEVLERLDLDRAQAVELVRQQPDSRVALRNLALCLHQLYACIEDIAYRVSTELNGEVPTGRDAHQALIDRVYLEVPGKREALFQTAAREDLDELRRFRHFIRHNYGAELDPGRLLAVGECATRATPCVRADVQRFRDRLASADLPNDRDGCSR